MRINEKLARIRTDSQISGWKNLTRFRQGLSGNKISASACTKFLHCANIRRVILVRLEHLEQEIVEYLKELNHVKKVVTISLKENFYFFNFNFWYYVFL